MFRKASTLAISLALAGCASTTAVVENGVDKLQYHHGPIRNGWNASEHLLTPANVGGGNFGLLWESEELDSYEAVPPRLFATPLYLHALAFGSGPAAGRTLPVAFIGTTTGYAYAIATAQAGHVAPGTVLWKRRLTETPCSKGQMGILSTPVIDRSSNRIYFTSCSDDWIWNVHALDLATGAEAAGWPVEISHRTLTADLNRNGTTQFVKGQPYFQRGSLNISADGRRLYAAFGPDMQGWLVSVDTRAAAISSAFSSMPRSDMQQGGMWGSSGPSIDADGRIYVATGASFAYALEKRGIPGVFPESDNAWGQSILQFRDDPEKGLQLVGSYSPYNYCQTAAADIDIAGSGPVVIDLPAGATTTRRLLALGPGKQGNAYLLDRDAMPGGTVRRHGCSTDPATDGSLLAPEIQPELGSRGPINVFGPFSDSIGMVNSAKSRSTLAQFTDAGGNSFLFLSGSAKEGEQFDINVPPGLVRVRIVTEPNRAAFLRVDALEKTQTFQNPGSPVITSSGSRHPIVWVLDTNVPRSTDIFLRGAPGSRLYAFDAGTLALLWHSGAEMRTSGKYNEPTVVDGLVLVGTDRLQAFGVGGKPPILTAPAATTLAAPSANAGETLFATRCASCHTSTGSNAPAAATIAMLPRRYVVDALKTGKMQAMATGLTDQEIGSIADYLMTLGKNKGTRH